MSKTERYDSAEKKRRIPRFLIGILILIVVNAVVIFFVLRWLWSVVDDFEQHLPQTALTTYFTQLSSGEYDEIKRTSGFTPGEQGSWDDYFEILHQRFDAPVDTLVYGLANSTDLGEGETRYSVYSGEDKLGEVIVSEDAATASGWSVRSAVDYIDGYTITAPPFALVSINGTQLTQDDVTSSLPLTITYIKSDVTGETPVTVDIFSRLNDASLAPTMVQYQTAPTLRQPVFTAVTADGKELVVQVNDETRMVEVSLPPDDAQAAESQQIMETVARAYSDFITEDNTLANLRQYVYADTQLNKDFGEYQRGWYLNHESREFSEFTFSDIHYHSGTCFTGHIDFTVTIVRQGTVHTFDASYDMAFLFIDGKWQLVGLHARSQQ